ncbi:MFS transporter [Planomonospora parontospora subsp. parontospora]|uniref:MFS transporter n=2 Tax=Planomonospora parontospora TaxID=58119 RepID=A0ABQ4HGK4_9ACTN|nr:MFS transporter [Planomonospora parontospora]GGK94669.1 MFS transporter [Planomonospora parontospora]GII11099.1 MFS transporter [Planomonospora parontospora subsp. parontospora]
MAGSQTRRVVLAGLIGTSLEWYDFFLYGSAAALVFNKLFFPTFEPLTGTLLALLTYAIGFVARPLGGIVFGHFGDRAGRKNVLVATLLLMGIATFLIGLLPTYATLGVAAPLLLVALRFLQGLGLGGEWGGAVLMSIEHGDPGRRGFNASWPQAGVPAGNLLAAGVLGIMSAALPEEAFLSWGWRVPFLLSGLLVAVGLWIRLRIVESPLFAEVEQSGQKAKMPLLEVLRTHPRALASAFCARIGVDVAFYTFVTYSLSYVSGTLKLDRGVALNAVLIGSAVQLFLIPLFGALSDRVGRRPVYLAGTAATALWVFAFFPLLDSRSFPVIALASIVALACHAAMYGPQAAFIAELFSTRLRYSGASMGYQVAGIFGGALAPIVALELLGRFQTTVAISLYVVAALAVTAAGLLIAPESASQATRVPPATNRAEIGK